MQLERFQVFSTTSLQTSHRDSDREGHFADQASGCAPGFTNALVQGSAAARSGTVARALLRIVGRRRHGQYRTALSNGPGYRSTRVLLCSSPSRKRQAEVRQPTTPTKQMDPAQPATQRLSAPFRLADSESKRLPKLPLVTLGATGVAEDLSRHLWRVATDSRPRKTLSDSARALVFGMLAGLQVAL